MSILSNLANFTSTLPNPNLTASGGSRGRGSEVEVYHKKGNSKAEAFLEAISLNGYDVGNLKKIFDTRGSQLILAAAGSGKTTTMVFKVVYDTLTGELTRTVDVNETTIRVLDRVWVSTFLKTGALDLELKLREVQREYNTLNMASSFTFSTLHAEFNRLLNSLGIPTKFIDDSAARNNLRQALREFRITNNGKSLNAEQLGDLEGALTYTRNRLDARRYSSTVYRDLGLSSMQVDYLLKRCKELRQEEGLVDFEDLQEQLYEEAVLNPNPAVVEAIQNRYNYIYLDEFQDTSQIQYEILKVYASGCKKFIAIGDDDQTIYSWRGSDHTIITEDFERDFSPTVSTLGQNYRCPETILRAIIPSIEKNAQRHPKELTSASEGGVLRVGYFRSYSAMVRRLTELVTEDVVAQRSVAILCRVNTDGLIPAMALNNAGNLDFALTSKRMTLSSPIGTAAMGILKLFTERATPAVKRTLEQLTWERWEVAKLLDVCKSEKVFFWDIPEKDLLYSCPNIGRTLVSWIRYRKEFGEVETLKRVLMYYYDEVYTGQSQYVTVMRTTIQSLRVLLDQTPAVSVLDFQLDVEDIDAKLVARVRDKETRTLSQGVVISTVHDFKGKEADSVYIWNDVEEVFPHKSSTETLEDLEEERRVHYIANTRARQISTIMSIEGKSGMFLNEMNLLEAERVDYPNTNGGRLR